MHNEWDNNEECNPVEDIKAAISRINNFDTKAYYKRMGEYEKMLNYAVSILIANCVKEEEIENILIKSGIWPRIGDRNE